MPAVRIHVLAGHPKAALRRLMANVAAAITNSLETELERLSLWIDELDPALRLIDGRPASDLLTSAEPSVVDAPFVDLYVLAGRPIEMLHRVEREITEGVVRALGTKRDRVRVLVHEVPADRWSIGGLPATVPSA